jgi:hypothetical protein
MPVRALRACGRGLEGVEEFERRHLVRFMRVARGPADKEESGLVFEELFERIP